jgi:SsrA-binding protein
MPERETIALNRRARHDYDIIETFDAGIMLTGTEIKSVRARRVDLKDSFAAVEREEIWLHNMHISPYEPGSRDNPFSRRTRKLLLHRREINRLLGRTVEKGLTIVPLKIYLERGFAKVEIGLARGRREYDKRQAIAAREARLEKDRAFAERQRRSE